MLPFSGYFKALSLIKQERLCLSSRKFSHHWVVEGTQEDIFRTFLSSQILNYIHKPRMPVDLKEFFKRLKTKYSLFSLLNQWFSHFFKAQVIFADEGAYCSLGFKTDWRSVVVEYWQGGISLDRKQFCGIQLKRAKF